MRSSEPHGLAVSSSREGSYRLEACRRAPIYCGFRCAAWFLGSSECPARLVLASTGACQGKRPERSSSAARSTTSAPLPSRPPCRAADRTVAGPSTALPAFDRVQLKSFAPILEGVEKPKTNELEKLGRMLYFDTRLCLGQDVSCASCHDLARAGVDGEVQSTGTKQQRGKRNTPTVLNAGGSFAQGWDARATTIEEFVLPHMTDPVIMGMDEKRVVDTIESVLPTRLRSGRCSPTISPPFRERRSGAHWMCEEALRAVPLGQLPRRRQGGADGR